MDKLPSEILCEIFFRAVSIATESYKLMPKCDRRTPLFISHVCRTWRDIALSDGRLWSYLHINLSALRSARKKNGLRIIFDTWIARSGTAPLNYTIGWDFERASPSKEGVKCAVHIATTMIKERHRWADVDFLGALEYGCPEDRGPLRLTDMPMLTKIRLIYKSHRRLTFDLGRSPQLRRVELYGNFAIAASERSLRHLREPSSLRFQGDYKAEDVVQSCQNFLAIAPFLEELHLDFEDRLRPSDPLGGYRPVYIGLRRLSLSPRYGPEVFVDNVVLPSLEALHFACKAQEGGQKLLRFFERSLPPLTHLSIRGDCAHEDFLIPCLGLLPALKDLQVAWASMSTRFFRELSVQGNEIGGITCPLLEAFHLSVISCLEDPVACAEALISMLESRATITKTFENVCILALRPSPTVHPSRLREYDQEKRETFFTDLKVGQVQVPFSFRIW